MTYCLGIKINKGLLFMSDTRTHAGVDNISTFKKIFTFNYKGKVYITILASGTLATTQFLVNSLNDIFREKNKDKSKVFFQNLSLFDLVKKVGKELKKIIAQNAEIGQKADTSFHANLILGGQVKGEEPKLFLIYPQGNFIESSTDAPFFQIGETKYGKPILVRAYDPFLSFEETIKLMLLSFDSTLKANLSVGLPLDFQIYENNTFIQGPSGRFESGDQYLADVSSGWSHALKNAFKAMPNLTLEKR
jgi:putative proteasome-type protease